MNFQPQKEDPHYIRITVVGDIIDYPQNKSTPTCNLIVDNEHWNTIISTKGARYIKTDIKDLYLNTPLDNCKYMQTFLADITDDII